MDSRLVRRFGSGTAAKATDAVDGPAATVATAGDGAFRDDLERIRFSPYFSRLAAVTQVVSPGAIGNVVNNRLTHTIKVTAVGRAIAVAIRNGPQAQLAADLGGCDHVVVQAAASAHDLGHPPFGHLGERILDRLARSRFGLTDGFEGNAQSFRILTALDVHGDAAHGLDLTAAVRAAVLKYPWARFGRPDPHPSEADPVPRGAGVGEDGRGSTKFSAYVLQVPEMESVRAAYPGLGAYRQTVECSVMDVADDIAYSLHDLDDFHRAGVLQHAAVAAEFRTWTRQRSEWESAIDADLRLSERLPGRSLELLRRRMIAKDSWIFDDEVFSTAVGRVAGDLVDGLLAVPFDSSIAAERAVEAFTASWIAHLQESIVLQADPHPRSAYVALDRQAWHEVAVLKFVHQRFVLDRADLAMFQRGQGHLLNDLVAGLDAWLTDPVDAARAPRRLVDLVELATGEYAEIADTAPDLLIDPTGDPANSVDDLRRLGRGRGIIDYVASLTDDEAVQHGAMLAGGAARLIGGSR